MQKWKSPLFILFFAYFIISVISVKWGIPSVDINNLYFYNSSSMEKHLEIMESHTDDLPRSFYNPIRSYHPDEYFIIKSLSAMQPKKIDFNPGQYTVGGAYLYLVGFILFLLSRLNLIKLTTDMGFYFLNPDKIGVFYIVGRTITILYGLGIIFFSYLILKKLLKDRNDIFFTLLLLFFSPLMILNTVFMYVDIPGVFWVMASLYATILLMEKFSFRRLFLAGVFAGLACGNKITFAVAFFIPLAGILLSNKNLKEIIKKMFIAFTGFILTFFITNPYFFLTFPTSVIELQEHTTRIFSAGFYIDSLSYGLGAPLFIYVLIGLCSILVFFKQLAPHQKKILLLSALWSVFFFLFISAFSKRFARYILPIVPPMIILGSVGWSKIHEHLKSNTGKNAIRIISILTICGTFIYGMSYTILFQQENIRTKAGIWIKKNIPLGSSIGITEVPWQLQMPPFDYYVYRVDVTGYNIMELKEQQPEYFILSSFQAPIPPYPIGLQKERMEFYKAFIESGLYTEEKRFEKSPTFAGICFKAKQLPEDLIYLNPTIVVFKRQAGDKKD